ncbi:hypothetical protein BDR26DRAFT_858704, partial [Obelidium mucronatum]
MPPPITFAHLPSETIDAILIHLPINRDLVKIALASKHLLAPFLFASQPFANRHCNYQATFIDKAQFTKPSLTCNAVAYIVSCPRKHLTMQYWIYRCLLEGRTKSLYRSTVAIVRADEMMTALNRRFNSIVHILWVEGVGITDTHLNIAVSTGNSELVGLFVEHPNIPIIGGFLIDAALESGDQKTINIIMDHPKTILRELRWDRYIPNTRILPARAGPENTKVLRFLLSHPKTDPSALENLALKSACAKHNFEVIDLLLQDPRVDPFFFGGRLLQLACKMGNVELLNRLLLDSRFQKFSESDFDSLMLLRIAFKKEYPQIVELLVRHMEVKHVLRVATEYQNLKVLERLCLLNMLGSDYEDSNALRVACLDGNTDVVRLLLLKRWERTENEGLEWAAIGGSVEATQMLVDDGVNASANDFCAMRAASLMQHDDIMRLLLLESRELKDRVWPGLWRDQLESSSDAGEISKKIE